MKSLFPCCLTFLVLGLSGHALTEPIRLTADVRGKSEAPGGTVEYEVVADNTTDLTQAVSLTFDGTTWEAMGASVEPTSFELSPHTSRTVKVRVSVPARVPPGGHEKQTLRASPGVALELVTASLMPHPYILHTKDGWNEVREKVTKYEWAKAAAQEYIERAGKWKVPSVANPKNPAKGDWLFHTQTEHDLMAAGIAYQLTLENKYAEKVRLFLLRLSDPLTGFPVTRRGCHQASVQEGHFFQHIAMAYDMALPSGIFSEKDREQIEHTLRLFVGNVEGSFGTNISNWAVSYQCGQLYCALVLQDLAAADRILFGHGALIDQFVQGTLDDGWWYEVSISYNTWVATEFSQVALAMRPWGMDLANMWFQSGYRPQDTKPPSQEEYGMSRARWGPIRNNYITLKRMWDVLPRMVDWRGIIFGLNDSTEKPISGPQMDIAYYLFRDPAYATMIRRSGEKRNLLYGVPELPQNTPDRSLESTCSDNAGVAVLRSQTQGRPPREQIQAVLHYGDHGWYHGHFSKLDLVHLSRYGRSFYNPEFIWYGYGSYLYKFYVQTSLNHNMVVVDRKLQEPAECRPLLFHRGKMMQVSAVESKTRWSNPPYGGMVYPPNNDNRPTPQTFPEKALDEGRSIPIPPNPPTYGKMNAPGTSLSGYTEPVLQRRMLVVTDDYIVVADALSGEQEHTFDSILHLKNFQGLEAAGKKLVRHTGQLDPDPLGSGQFITDCDWYEIEAPAKTSWSFRWGPGFDEPGTNNEGILNIDVHTLWPPKCELMLATPPINQPVARQVSWNVSADGRSLSEGKSGIWILGEQTIDLPIEGVRSLELSTRTGSTKPGTLFWGNARIVTADGKEIPLGQLPLATENTMQAEKGKDFSGGPIKLAGISYTEAVSAQPLDGKDRAITRVDLSQVQATRFRAILGGDFPVGEESDRRRTLAVRSRGKSARFLSILEPLEDQRTIRSAIASSPDTIRVELIDGRVQELEISGLDTGSPRVEMAEKKGSEILRREVAEPAIRLP